MEIKTIYTIEEAQQAKAWFLESCTDMIGLDTETMGRNWFAVKQKLYEEKNLSIVKELEKELAIWAKKKEAVNHRTNYLATVQLSCPDEKTLIFVMKKGSLALWVIDFLNEIQLSRKPRWIIQNAKFDVKQLDHHLKIDTSKWNIYDTMLAENLIIGDRETLSSSLRSVTERYGVGMEKGGENETVSDWWTYPLTPSQEYYAAADSLLVLKIYDKQQAAIEQKRLKSVVALENAVVYPLVKMESRGLRYDKPALQKFILKSADALHEYRVVYNQVFKDVNPSSPKQVLEKIKEQYGVEPMATAWDYKVKAFVSKPSVDKKTLLIHGLMDEPSVRALIQMKELSKNVETAKKWLTEGDEFLPSYNQVAAHYDKADDSKDGGARTGRMSSSPNIQNIPNFMKQFLVAPDGYVILDTDYKAIELRMMGSFSGDKTIKKYFEDDIDPHTDMAATLFNKPYDQIDKKGVERKLGKQCNFGFVFGMRAKRFCTQTLVDSDGELRITQEEGETFRQKYFNKYSAVTNWHNLQFAEACLNGYITTRSGRRRYYNFENRPDGIKPSGKVFHPRLQQWIESQYATDWKWRNVALNTPVQGSAGDGMKYSLVLMHRDDKPDFIIPVVTVHDSLGCFVKEDRVEEAAAFIFSRMIQGMSKFLPDVKVEVECTYGKCWANPPSKGDILVQQGLWVQPETYYQKGILV